MPKIGFSPRLDLTASQVYEAKAFEFLGKPSINTKVASVGVPRLLSFDKDNHALIMEDVGSIPSLKSWLTADSPRDQVTSVGRSLGSYLAHIHNTTANNSTIKEAFDSNDIGKNVSSSMYYAGLPAAAEKFGYTQPFITAAASFAEHEVLTANEVLTLGDFWTGNVLVSAPTEQGEPKLTSWTLSWQNLARQRLTLDKWAQRCFVSHDSGPKIEDPCCSVHSSRRTKRSTKRM